MKSLACSLLKTAAGGSPACEALDWLPGWNTSSQQQGTNELESSFGHGSTKEIPTGKAGCVSPRCDPYRVIPSHLCIPPGTAAPPARQLLALSNARGRGPARCGDSEASSPALLFSLFPAINKTYLGQETTTDSGKPFKATSTGCLGVSAAERRAEGPEGESITNPMN